MVGVDLTEISEAFTKVCTKANRDRFKLFNTKRTDVFDKFIIDTFEKNRNNFSKGIGYWVRSRVILSILKGEQGWTATTVEDHLYHLCQTSRPSRDLAPRRFSCLVEADPKPSHFAKLASLIEDFNGQWEAEIWPKLGSEEFQGKKALDIPERSFLSDYFSTASSFEQKLCEVLEKPKGVITNVEKDTTDLDGVPSFAAVHVPEQKRVVESLIDFIKTNQERTITAIAGEPSTGKRGIFTEIYRRLYVAGERGGDRHVICLNVSQLRSFDVILSRLNSFTRRAIACELNGKPVALAKDSYEQPLEINITGFTENLRQLKRRGVLFVFADVDAVIHPSNRYMLLDERLNWLARIIASSGESHKVVFGLIPSGAKLAEAFKPKERNPQLLAFIEPPGTVAMSAFTKTFPGGIGLKDRMDLAFKDVSPDDSVKSTVIIAALGLHKMAENRGIAVDEINGVIQASLDAPDTILREILRLTASDKRAMIALVLLALSPEGIRRDTLIKFLRYHREYSSFLHQLPDDCLTLTRKELAASDDAFRKNFEVEHSVLVGHYKSDPRFRDNEAQQRQERGLVHHYGTSRHA